MVLLNERGEIAVHYKGGLKMILIKSDILGNISKFRRIKVLISSMSPKVIVTDEMDVKENEKSINLAICSSYKGIFTSYCCCFDYIYLNLNIKVLMNACVFKIFIFKFWKKIWIKFIKLIRIICIMIDI